MSISKSITIALIAANVFNFSCSETKSSAQHKEQPKKQNTSVKQDANTNYQPVADEKITSTFQAVEVSDAGINPAIVKGLHLCTKWRGTLDAEALKNPDLTTVTLFAYWSDLNPSKGQYNWERLDGELNRFVAAGKNIGISIAAGGKSPEWIYNEGVRHFTYTEFQHQGKGKKSTVEQSVVYDKAYIELYSKFIRDLAAHMKQQKYWSKLVLIGGSGINQSTAELHLPAQVNKEQNGEKSSDAVALWKQFDYDPNKVISAFKQIMNVVAESFPNRIMVIPVFNMQQTAFPQIGTAQVGLECLTWMKQTYPNRMAAKFTVLQANYTPKGFVKQLLDIGIPVGYQLSQIRLEDNADDADFQQAIQAGIDANALFIEVFPANAKKFQSSIKKLSPKVQYRK